MKKSFVLIGILLSICLFACGRTKQTGTVSSDHELLPQVTNLDNEATKDVVQSPNAVIDEDMGNEGSDDSGSAAVTEYDYTALVAMEYESISQECLLAECSDFDTSEIAEGLLPQKMDSFLASGDDTFWTAVELFYGTATVPCNVEQAKELFVQTAEDGNADAYYFLSCIAAQREDYPEAVRLARLSMDGESALGYFRMGVVYLDLDYILSKTWDDYDESEFNATKAEQYFQKAIELGLTDAYYGLGALHHGIANREDARLEDTDYDLMYSEREAAKENYNIALTGILPEIVAKAYKGLADLNKYETDYSEGFRRNRDAAYAIFKKYGEYGNADAWLQAGRIMAGFDHYGERVAVYPELEIEAFLKAYELGNVRGLEQINYLIELDS